MAKVGWVSTIGEDAVKSYRRVPPHEDTVPQSAEKGGVVWKTQRKENQICTPPSNIVSTVCWEC